MERFWILIGMMGSGKSTIGRLLAEQLDVEFLDTDLLLQHRFGRSVSAIFDVYGEATFRDHETSVLRGLEPRKGVLATGGGVVLREINWQELRRLGKTVFLEIPVEVLIERLSVSRRKRPLLAFEDWQDRYRRLYEERIQMYRKADTCVRIERESMEQAVEALKREFESL